jgi:methionyl-tRNA formyltransferase
MRFGAIGRSRLLFDTIEALVAGGHRVDLIQTCPAEGYYGVGEAEFRALAARLGAPFVCDRHAAACLDVAGRGEVDVAVSVNWPTLVPRAVREAFRHGVLNAHAGDLPRYRGNACPNWAILNFETQVVLTIHRMTDELDAGPWLVKDALGIDEATYIGDIYRWLEARTPTLFVEAIDRLTAGGFHAVDPAVRPSRMFPRRPEDGRIDWKAPARDVLALIRASSRPFEGAFSYLEGERLIRVFRARRFDPGYDFCAVPGQVCLRHAGNPVVAAGDGMIEIEDCAAEGLDAEGAKALVARSLRNRLT